MPNRELNRFFIVLTAAALASCQAPVTQSPDPQVSAQGEAMSTPQISASPDVSVAPKEPDAIPEVTQRKLSLEIAADDSLQGFAIKQSQGVCLSEIKQVKTRMALPSNLPETSLSAFKAQGFTIEGNQLILNSQVLSLDAFVQGFKFELTGLPAGSYAFETQLQDQTGSVLGKVNFSVVTQDNSAGHTVKVIFKPLETANPSQSCPVLTADFTGATFESAEGGLVLPIANAPQNPPPSPIPSPSAEDTTPVVSPLAPSDLKVVFRSTGALTLQWSFEENRAHSYRLLLDGQVVATGITRNYFTFSNLSPDTNYTLGVQAVIGEQFSQEASSGGKTTFAGSTGSGGFGGSSGSSGSGTTNTTPVQATPAITAITPANAVPGASVTLTGTDFDATTSNNTVRFGATAATVTLASANSLTVTVPALAPGATNVTVEVGGKTSNAFNFTVNAPVNTPTITQFTPATNVVGGQVVITGTNFDATPNNNTVKFGTTTATVTAASPTSLTVTVPAVTPGATNVTVQVGANTSAPSAFTVSNTVGVVSVTNATIQSAEVDMDSDGDFVVAWKVTNGAVDAQRFNGVGAAQGGLINVVTSANGSQPDVAIDSDGDFVVSWDNTSGVLKDVRGKRYNAAGLPQGVDLLLTNGDHTQSDTAMDNAGNFVVVSTHTDPYATTNIKARRYNAAGTSQGDTTVVTLAGISNPKVAMNKSNGDFVVIWTQSGIKAQRYNAAGAAQGGVIDVVGTGTNYEVAMDEDGDFVVTWQAANTIFAQRYNAGGTAQGTAITVAQAVVAGPYLPGPGPYLPPTPPVNHDNPSVAIDSDGDFVVSWETTTDGSVDAQRYNAAGVPQGSKIDVAAGSKPQVAVDSDGDFVVIWQNSGMKAKLFGPDGTPK